MSNPLPSNRESRPGEAGKSIIEVTAIFMIVGIVMAFSLPAVATSIRAYNLRSTANRLAEKLSAARSLAMTKNESVSFSIKKASGEFGFDFNADGTPDTTDPDDPGATYNVDSLPSSISLESDALFIPVKFNSRGELPIGTTVEPAITIENRGRKAIVRVNLRGKIWVE